VSDLTTRGLAIAALALSLFALWRSFTSTGVREAVPTSAASVTTAAIAPPAALRSGNDLRVRALEERVRRLETRPSDGGAAPAASSVESETPGADSIRYVSFEPPTNALRVTQDEDGNLQVVNRDPQLTGKYFIVQARRADGTVDEVSVIAPAP
jgi:hypothetical protein